MRLDGFESILCCVKCDNGNLLVIEKVTFGEETFSLGLLKFSKHSHPFSFSALCLVEALLELILLV